MRLVSNRQELIASPWLERLFEPFDLTGCPLVGDEPAIGVLDGLALDVGAGFIPGLEA